MSEQPILPIGDIANNYDANPMVRMYGRGPSDATCKSCRHILATGYHTSRTYWKCQRRGITHGQGTDHRLKWSACRLYEEATDD